MALQFLYKEWGSDVWENITDYVQEYPSWNLVLNTEFLSFTFKVMTPKDSEGNKLYPEEGFDICICEDISYTKVFQNLAGKIESVEIENIAYDYDNSDWDVLYTIDCIQRDCSKQPVKLDYKTTTAMNTILDDIIINNTYGNDNLGEGFLGGSLSGVQIPKYVNYSANLNVDSVDFSGEPSKAWSDIVRSLNYNWKAIYYVEPDDTYLINLVQQLIFFNNSGLSPEGSSYWSSGITDNTVKKPFQINPKFVSETLTPSQEQYIYLDHGFSIRSNTDKMKNWIDINALIQAGTDLQNFTKKGDGANNTFNLEEKAKDIIYVCRARVQCNIINVVNTTTFDINTGQAEKIVYYSNLLVQDSLVCKIVSSSITYFRPFTISSNRITLDSVIASLAYNDSFELVNGLDVYETSDADDDRPNYGVIKRAKATEKGSVKFQKYSIPNSVDVVSIWYYPLKDNNIPRIFEDEKKRHGLKYHKEQLDAPITEDELSKYYLGFEKKRKAQKVIKFESQRPDIIEPGYQIPVNCSFWNSKYNGLYIATSVGCQYDSDYGQAGKPTVTQKVELSNYDDSIINTLSSSKNNYSLSTPLVESKNISLFSSELQIMTQLINLEKLLSSDTFIFLSDRDGVGDRIYSMDIDGGNQSLLIDHDVAANNIRELRFDPTGRFIAYAVQTGATTSYNLWLGDSLSGFSPKNLTGGSSVKWTLGSWIDNDNLICTIWGSFTSQTLGFLDTNGYPFTAPYTENIILPFVRNGNYLPGVWGDLTEYYYADTPSGYGDVYIHKNNNSYPSDTILFSHLAGTPPGSSYNIKSYIYYNGNHFYSMASAGAGSPYKIFRNGVDIDPGLGGDSIISCVKYGLIIFSNNNTGNYQIYMCDINGDNVIRLTNNADNDTFADLRLIS